MTVTFVLFEPFILDVMFVLFVTFVTLDPFVLLFTHDVDNAPVHKKPFFTPTANDEPSLDQATDARKYD